MTRAISSIWKLKKIIWGHMKIFAVFSEWPTPLTEYINRWAFQIYKSLWVCFKEREAHLEMHDIVVEHNTTKHRCFIFSITTVQRNIAHYANNRLDEVHTNKTRKGEANWEKYQLKTFSSAHFLQLELVISFITWVEINTAIWIPKNRCRTVLPYTNYKRSCNQSTVPMFTQLIKQA